MDDIWEVISKISAIISIPAALLAWWQALRAKKSADKAQDIENRLQSFDDYADFSKIETSLIQAIDDIKPFGPGCSKESIKGLDFQKALESTRTHIVVTRKYAITDVKTCENYCRSLENILSYPSSDNSDKIRMGRSVFSELTKFQGFVNDYKKKNKLNIVTGKNYSIL